MTGISDSRGPRLPPLHSGPQYKTPSALNLVKFEIVMPISTNAGSKMQVRPQLNNINKRSAAADRKGNLIWRCTDHTRGIPSSHGWARQFIGDAYSSLEEDYQYEVHILFQNKTLVSSHGEWLLVLIIGYFRLLMGIGIPKIDTCAKMDWLSKPDACLKNPALPLENGHFVTVVNSFKDGDSIIFFFLAKTTLFIF